MEPVTKILVAVGALVAIGGIAYASSAHAATKPPPPPPTDLSPATCAAILAHIPPDVAAKAVAAVPFDWKAGNEQQVANALAAYLSSHGYPSVAKCLQANPMLIHSVPPVAMDCATVMSKIPDAAKTTLATMLASAGGAGSEGAILTQASAFLRSVGATQAADCIEHDPTLISKTGGTGTGPGGTPPNPAALDACKNAIAAVPAYVWAPILASATTPTDVAAGLDLAGQHGAADCVRQYGSALPIPTGL
jgi:hypothetical protein